MLASVVTPREPKMLRGSSCGGRRYRLFRSVIILSMSDQPEFDYGEEVQVTSKAHNGCIAAVVGINGSESSRTYTVEFGDGSEADIGEEGVSIVKTWNRLLITVTSTVRY